jgi:hypothetical protein
VSAEGRASAIKQIVADLDDGFGLYRNGDYPGAKLDAVMEQLNAAIAYLEITIGGVTPILQPLRDHLFDLMDLHSGRRPKSLEPPVIPGRNGRDGQPPIDIKETWKRGYNLALDQLYKDAKTEKTARAFRGASEGQITNWRKRADPAVKLIFARVYHAYKTQYPDAPGKAAEALKKELGRRKFT